MERQHGYTIVELTVAIFAVVVLVGIVTVLGFGCYAAWHFIQKVW